MTEEQDEARGLALGAVDYITKPFSPGLVKSRVNNQLELKRHRDHLEELVKERTRELELTQEVTIESMASLAEYRDPETGGHIKRTKNYIKVLALHMKDHPKFKTFLDDKTIELLYQSAPLHDIGKVAIEDSVLLKPGKLTDEEFAEMKKHTVYGRDAIHGAVKKLGPDSFMRYAEEIAYTHQEKWDGSGYPQGLKGEDIPISGRLMAVADVYDALISHRVYKKPFSHTKAVNIILEGKSSHFDPDMVDAFMDIQEEFRQIALQFADFDEEKDALAEPYQG
jgi:putative two-component system response regulator